MDVPHDAINLQNRHKRDNPLFDVFFDEKHHNWWGFYHAPPNIVAMEREGKGWKANLIHFSIWSSAVNRFCYGVSGRTAWIR